MQFAMQALADSFRAQTGQRIQLIISSSGKLKAQIQEGAPYELFVSADQRYPWQLFKQGLGISPPRIYAYGRLVLWTISPDIPLHLDSLVHPRIRRIAIPNPKLAPYGLAAREALTAAGLWEALQAEIVRAESISQTNQFILSGGVEAGITALASVRTTKLQGEGRWVHLDSTSHTPIAQAALLLADTPAARQVYDFLFSPSAASILSAYGYQLP